MVRGLKKKLLIGLLSAAVVGTSLAPSVPLVGSFAQEVKADPGEAPATNTVVKSLSLTGEVTGYRYIYGNPNASEVEGWTATDEYYKGNPGTDENKINGAEGENELITAYRKYTKVVEENTETGYFAVSVTSTPSQVTFAKPSKPADSVDGKFYLDEECSANEVFGNSAEYCPNDSTERTLTVYYKAKDTSKANVTISDGDESTTAGGDIAVTNPTIEQKGEVSVSATVGQATIIKTGVDTVIKAILSNIPDGKKVKKVEATYKKDGVDVTVEGAFNEVTKEVSFELGKVVDDIAVTIVATVEDVKIKPTIDTSRLKDATAAFEGVTEVKQIGGELVVAVTPSDSKYLDDLALAGVITVKTTDGEVFTNAGKLSGRIIFKYDDAEGFKSATPKVVVSGGLANNAEETSGKDYSKVTAPYDVAIDNTEVLAAYKALHPDSDKNSAVTITATSSEDVPDAFIDAINGEQNKNENIKTAITVTVTVKGGETATAAATATAGNATDDVTEFDTPIAIKVLLPVEAQGKGGYMVYRSHNNRVEKLTTTLVGGEGVVVNGKELTIYTKKLSDFTVLYDSSLTSNTEENNNGENNNGENNENNNSENNGSNSSSSNGTTATTSTAKAATSTTKAAKATTSTKKSSKTSSPKTADYAVNSLLALLTGAAGLFGITLINKKRKEDEE